MAQIDAFSECLRATQSKFAFPFPEKQAPYPLITVITEHPEWVRTKKNGILSSVVS